MFLGGSLLHLLRFNGDRELTALLLWYLDGSWPLTAYKHVLAIEGRLSVFSGLGQEAAAPCLWRAPQKAEACNRVRGSCCQMQTFLCVSMCCFSFSFHSFIFFFLKASQLGLRRKAAV